MGDVVCMAGAALVVRLFLGARVWSGSVRRPAGFSPLTTLFPNPTTPYTTTTLPGVSAVNMIAGVLYIYWRATRSMAGVMHR